MPIGKNAIKRVNNNGYSKVQTSAPDMENSEIITEQAKEPKKKATSNKTTKAQKETKVTTSNKTAKTQKEAKTTQSRKTTATVKKSMETEPSFAPENTPGKVISSEQREGEGYVNLGGKLPDYLL